MVASMPVGRHATHWAWWLLGARTASFLVAQAGIAAALALAGRAEPWWASAAWWPVAATLANLAGAALLAWRMRVEGQTWRQLLRWDEARWRDVGWVLALLPLVGAAGAWPAIALAHAVWGDPTVGQTLLVGALPTWAAWVSLLAFPLTTGAVELPTYAGYVLPRLRAAGIPPIAAVLVVGGALGLQHGALPFVPATGFFVWRTLMFVPFAWTLVAVLAWRPGLLPWWMAVHVAIDAVAGAAIWAASP